jgi:hypothetical protein
MISGRGSGRLGRALLTQRFPRGDPATEEIEKKKEKEDRRIE